MIVCEVKMKNDSLRGASKRQSPVMKRNAISFYLLKLHWDLGVRQKLTLMYWIGRAALTWGPQAFMFINIEIRNDRLI